MRLEGHKPGCWPGRGFAGSPGARRAGSCLGGRDGLGTTCEDSGSQPHRRGSWVARPPSPPLTGRACAFPLKPQWISKQELQSAALQGGLLVSDRLPGGAPWARHPVAQVPVLMSSPPESCRQIPGGLRTGRKKRTPQGGFDQGGWILGRQVTLTAGSSAGFCFGWWFAGNAAKMKTVLMHRGSGSLDGRVWDQRSLDVWPYYARYLMDMMGESVSAGRREARRRRKAWGWGHGPRGQSCSPPGTD